MGSAIGRIWKLHGDGRTVGPGEVVRPDERLHTPNMLGLGAQHVLAMFGATALVPVLTGFPVTTTAVLLGHRHDPVQPDRRAIACRPTPARASRSSRR